MLNFVIVAVVVLEPVSVFFYIFLYHFYSNHLDYGCCYVEAYAM